MDEPTPIRGIPVAHARTQPDMPEQDAPRPQPRRSLTGGLAVAVRGERGLTGLLVALLVGGGIGGGGMAIASPPVTDIRIEATITEQSKRIDEQGRRLDTQAVELGAVSASVREDSRRMWANQIQLTRWIASAVHQQNQALSAIAAKLRVEVDLDVEPLTPAYGPPDGVTSP